MSEKQYAVLKAYRTTLERIARNYQTPSQLARSCGDDFGLDYSEAIEMAYENMQAEAKAVLKRFRMPSEKRKAKGVGR